MRSVRVNFLHRHRGTLFLLWLHVCAVAAYVLINLWDLADHTASDVTVILLLAAANIAHWRLNERRRAQASIEQVAVLHEQARLLDLAQDAIFVWELESGALRFWNRGAEELYGWTQREVLG